VCYRKFNDWIDKNTDWKLVKNIPNRYPLANDPKNEFFTDFYIFASSEHARRE
jgi:hypothetical protein